ncbi:MAG: tRNA adenosine(34) deaminase TadA [Gammaproteobacteria bacterium]|nr:tRNA adenosine(34) deaminase TadA [Gammaproteobacteria bacterium]
MIESTFTAADIAFMQRAMDLARLAEETGEVPVGALIVKDGHIVAEGHNHPISAHDPSAHAEIVTLRSAAEHFRNYRLTDTTLYVTLEPCVMCAGAIIHARVKRVVYAATDPKAGAAGSVFDIFASPHVNHRVEIEGGLLAEESQAMLQAFFRVRRKSRD